MHAAWTPPCCTGRRPPARRTSPAATSHLCVHASHAWGLAGAAGEPPGATSAGGLPRAAAGCQVGVRCFQSKQRPGAACRLLKRCARSPPAALLLHSLPQDPPDDRRAEAADPGPRCAGEQGCRHSYCCYCRCLQSAQCSHRCTSRVPSTHPTGPAAEPHRAPQRRRRLVRGRGQHRAPDHSRCACVRGKSSVPERSWAASDCRAAWLGSGLHLRPWMLLPPSPGCSSMLQGVMQVIDQVLLPVPTSGSIAAPLPPPTAPAPPPPPAGDR